LNFLDLFSGIGGFRLGAEMAGLEFKNEFHSDIEEFPNKVYSKHFPNSIQLGDIRNINGHGLKKEYGSDWIITGGFPCQDISIAGKGAGLSGSRSGLWFEMQRIIGELRPRYAIMENVPALTFRGLDRVLGSLADIGYDAEWTVISARDIGASHLRKRIWIIAYPSQQQSSMCDSESSEQGQIKLGRMGGENELSNTDEVGQKQRKQSEIGQQFGGGGNARGESAAFDLQNELPNSNKIGREIWNRQSDGRTQESRTHEKVRCENWSLPQMVQANNGHLQWQRTFEPEFVRVVDGIPNQLDRIGACGNSIVPGIAKILFELCEINL